MGGNFLQRADDGGDDRPLCAPQLTAAIRQLEQADDEPPNLRLDHHFFHLQGAMGDRTVLQDLKAELESEDVHRNERERSSYPDLDSHDRFACFKWLYYLSKSGRSFSNLASMLRLSLFTYRELPVWPAKPCDTPPLTPDLAQMRLNLL